MQDRPNTEVQSDPEGPHPLVRHTRRKRWGRALMVWERDGKRGYQFEDGVLRVFTENFFDLLQPAIKPDPVLRHQLREQAREAGELADAEPNKRTGRATGPVPTLEDQVTVFKQLFPDGFSGVLWTDTHRARVSAKQLKRHRDAGITLAAEQLSLDALRACIDAGNHGEVMTRLLDVIEATDLATKSQLDVLGNIVVDAELADAIVCYLHEVRHGDLATMAGLRRALARHNVRKLAWQALTAPRALLYPTDHMCVRPSVVRAQAKLTMPGFKLGSLPSGEDYSRALELAMSVQDYLTGAGYVPRDLFDVTSFMRVTTAAAAKEQLVEAMVLRNAAEAAAPAAGTETSVAEVLATSV